MTPEEELEAALLELEATRQLAEAQLELSVSEELQRIQEEDT